MRIWSQVDKTDPADTKHVTQRGGFTAIDANSQFRKATEVFGPNGIGWGVDITNVSYPQNNTVVIQMEFWFEKRENHFPTFGCCKLGTTDRPDEDAFKKALTDGETKALSKLGFNHDVFRGRFDDNKYVAEQIKANTPKAEWHGPVQRSKFSDVVMQFNKDMDECKTMEEFTICKHNNKAVWEQIKLDRPKDAKLKNPDCTSGETTGGHIQRLHQHFTQVEEMNNMENR